MNYQKIIIIGAPRSGTNILRDVLTSLSGFVTWPCDEINYIWRHGNKEASSDEIPLDKITPEIKKYIRKQFDYVALHERGSFVVEKTCANSLRVPFVDNILPDAKYIFIYRDGIDVIGSAKKRWAAQLDLPYLISKARYVPMVDVPHYATRYLWSRLYRLFSSEKRLAFWGPSLEGMPDILQKHSLDEVCALQWARCVDRADSAFSSMPTDKVMRLSYEDFVRQPRKELKKILKFVGANLDVSEIDRAVENVSPTSLGKGRDALGKDNVRRLEQFVGDTLKRYGYL